MNFLLFLLTLAPPSKPTVVLTWVDNLNLRTATYIVYRGEAGCSASLQMIQVANDVREKTWVDVDVKQNRSYCYFVTATYGYDQSGPSNKVTISVPRPGTFKEKP